MAKAYFTLCIFDATCARWVPEAGDYVRSVVAQEWQDIKHNHKRGTKHTILKTSDDQKSIDKGVRALNGPGFVPASSRG